MADDDLEKIKTRKDKTIHILHFAKIAEIDPIYYEKDYYAIPNTEAEKAYGLLRQALLSQKKVAIAKTVMGTNEKLLVLYIEKLADIEICSTGMKRIGEMLELKMILELKRLFAKYIFILGR